MAVTPHIKSKESRGWCLQLCQLSIQGQQLGVCVLPPHSPYQSGPQEHMQAHTSLSQSPSSQAQASRRPCTLGCQMTDKPVFDLKRVDRPCFSDSSHLLSLGFLQSSQPTGWPMKQTEAYLKEGGGGWFPSPLAPDTYTCQGLRAACHFSPWHTASQYFLASRAKAHKQCLTKETTKGSSATLLAPRRKEMAQGARRRLGLRKRKESHWMGVWLMNSRNCWVRIAKLIQHPIIFSQKGTYTLRKS